MKKKVFPSYSRSVSVEDMESEYERMLARHHQLLEQKQSATDEKPGMMQFDAAVLDVLVLML